MDAWEQFLAKQEKRLGSDTVKKWLSPLQIARYDARNLYLEAGDSFQSLWFEEHIRKEAEIFFSEQWQRKVKIHIQVRDAPDKRRKTVRSHKAETPGRPSQAFSLSFDPLNPLCTLEHLVCTPSNLFVYKIISELTGLDLETGVCGESSWGAYNPLYFYGKKGTGKTHLLMALTHQARKMGLHALYVRADTFVNHVVSAIRAAEMSQFRQIYRHADILLIDDADTFAGKGGTQEELFHTFNALHMSGRQIVLAASLAPNELSNIEPRLVSRFEWGIVLSLSVMEKEERQQLIEAKARAMGFVLAPRVIEFVNEVFVKPHSAVRALEALALHQHRMKQFGEEFPQTLPAIKKILGPLILEEEREALNPDQILQAVVEYFGIPKEAVVGKAQTKECVLPRQVAMFLCRSLLKLPYMQIGTLFSRDHSTVMSSVHAIEKKISDNQAEVALACHKITHLLQP